MSDTSNSHSDAPSERELPTKETLGIGLKNRNRFQEDSSDSDSDAVPMRKPADDDAGNDAEVDSSVSSNGDTRPGGPSGGFDSRRQGGSSDGSDSDGVPAPRPLPKEVGRVVGDGEKGGSSGDDGSDEGGSDDTSSIRAKPHMTAKPMAELFGDDDEGGSDSAKEGDDEDTFNDNYKSGGQGGSVSGRTPSVNNDDTQSWHGDGSQSGHASQQEDLTLSIPELVRPGPDAKFFITRFPNILGIKTAAFDPEQFDQGAEDDLYKFTQNIIRWRHKKRDDASGTVERDEKGEPIRETNTRLVKWSDGSLQLLIGEEVFDAAEHKVQNSYMFSRQITQSTSCLECQGKLGQKLVFKPSSADSRAHRSLALAIRSRAPKTSRIMSYSETMDPEKSNVGGGRPDGDARKREKRRFRGYRGRNGDGSKRPNMSRSYLEDGVEYDETGIKSLKADTRSGRYDEKYNFSDTSSEGEDNASDHPQEPSESNFGNRPRRVAATKAAARSKASAAARGARSTDIAADDSESEESRDAASESEEETGSFTAPANEDDESADEDGEVVRRTASKGKRKRRVMDEEEYDSDAPSGSGV